MNKELARKDVQEYLATHEDTPLDKFIFKGSPFPEINIQELAQQLDGHRRSKHKLPLWYTTQGILFPPKLNLEQTSSAFTATYKAKLVTGETLLDMTGGFGIDSYYFAQQLKEIHHLEMNAELSAFAKANFATLNVSNITTYIGDSIAYLRQYKGSFDTIYVDPARRDDVKGKIFKLSDCIPNVVAHLDILLSKGKHILIKTSPLLDISAGLLELNQVSEIHVIAINNEVKELLWSITSKPAGLINIHTINTRGKAIEKTVCTLSEATEAQASYNEPQQFLYESNAALMKSGAFNWVSKQYAIAKLHPHSHLYTSNERIEFPGRRFKIQAVYPFDNKIKKQLTLEKANITTRNFKLNVAQLRKKLGIKDGGDHYLFFTTDYNERQIVIQSTKV